MNITATVYKDRVLACFTGKNIGGTMGYPMEFDRQKNIVTGYDESLDLPMPNDDLDLQLLWLIALEEKGCHITTERLAEYWQRYLTPHWAEYGISKVNMRSGILPPMSGTVNNEMYKNSNGAWIRSEIWACLAPAAPEAAARMALLDAMLDHGDGEGTWAEIFCAALESMAFAERDLPLLIRRALAFLPEDSGVYRAVTDACGCYDKRLSLDEAREFLLRHHRGRYGRSVSREDAEKGLGDGPIGDDAPLNVALVVAGLLYGEGDFDKTVTSTIFFGEDTDCTVGTAAAVFGLLYGFDAISEKWKAPVGNRITVGTLNLGELGSYGDVLPKTVEELTERIYRQHRICAASFALPSAADGFDTAAMPAGTWAPSAGFLEDVRLTVTTQYFRSDFYAVRVDYLTKDCAIIRDVPRKIRIVFENEYKTADIFTFRWILPEGVTVSPQKEGHFFAMLKGFPSGGSKKELEFTFLTQSDDPVQRYLLEITVEGRSSTLYVPVLFLLGCGS